MSEIIKALAAAKAEMPPVPKKATNPHFRSKYATLDDIDAVATPILARHGLAIVLGGASMVDGSLIVSSRLIHSSGESMDVPVAMPGSKLDPQGVGAAITYARRYGYGAVGIVTDEDDDGNSAQPEQPKSPERPKQWKDAVTGGPLNGDAPAKAAPPPTKAATAQPAPKPDASTGGGITEAQGKRLFAKARDAGLMPKGADGRLSYAPYHKFLADAVGVKDDRHLTREQYDEVCSMLDALKDGTPIDDTPPQLPIHGDPADAGADDIPF